jgi:hypothetical protein
MVCPNKTFSTPFSVLICSIVAARNTVTEMRGLNLNPQMNL